MVVGRRVVEVLLKGLNILNIKDIDKNKEHILMGGKGINIKPELATGVGCLSDISTITLLQCNINGETKKPRALKK
jgi:hypothetical protein